MDFFFPPNSCSYRVLTSSIGDEGSQIFWIYICWYSSPFFLVVFWWPKEASSVVYFSGMTGGTVLIKASELCQHLDVMEDLPFFVDDDFGKCG